ncbi:hypothetical protein B0H17DRAFT_1213657 [Mycena rosella]|uniref:Uncharacterized protein n=1 Tax=Mycena rosella TaxID=1033263 RepID=A0AAD7CPQ7_MYCRO|nr:hypothetical protein B0H17DRAFT_1213657 [Mycena rosella]
MQPNRARARIAARRPTARLPADPKALVFRLVAVRVHASSPAACVRRNVMYTTGLGPAAVSSFLRGRRRHCSRASCVLDSCSASEPQSYLAACLHQYNTNANGGVRASHRRPPERARMGPSAPIQ